MPCSRDHCSQPSQNRCTSAGSAMLTGRGRFDEQDGATWSETGDGVPHRGVDVGDVMEDGAVTRSKVPKSTGPATMSAWR